jgi:hypothetical protein
MDFWSLLISPNQDNAEDLAKLNECGSKINIMVEEINLNFQKMQKLRLNDQEVLRYYSDFLNDILNDKEKAAIYKSRLNEVDNEKLNLDDLNFLNNDANALSSTDENQFIIIHAQEEKLGVIKNLSLGICLIFGYTKQELVGKNIEILMPEIYHKYHKTILLNRLNAEKKKDLIAKHQNQIYKTTWKDVNGYGKNKSRNLIPTFFKVAYLPNEENNESVFIAKLNIENKELKPGKDSFFVLVSPNFVIQNFTSNCISSLGLNSNIINNVNFDILKCIIEYQKELALSEESQDHYNNNSNNNKLIENSNIKRSLLMTKFRKNVKISWRMYDYHSKKRKNFNIIYFIIYILYLISIYFFYFSN